MNESRHQVDYVLCIHSKGSEDLEKGKVYQVLQDEKARLEGYLRVIDESDEDYLYPDSNFVPLEIPIEAQDALFTRDWA